jgi:hypothetical protein
MRFCILVALVPCALLAQTSPPRPADQDNFRHLPPRLSLIQPAAQAAAVRRGEPSFVLTLVKKCSIPLLRAPVPERDIDKISVPVPRADKIDPKFLLTPPAVCEDWKP